MSQKKKRKKYPAVTQVFQDQNGDLISLGTKSDALGSVRCIVDGHGVSILGHLVSNFLWQ